MCVTGERGQKVMQITDVRVRKVAKEGKLKAVVSITMDEEFVVHDSGTRDRIQKIILDKYAEVLEETDDAETAEI